MIDQTAVLSARESFVDAVLNTFPLGVAVCNRRFQYELVNESLAAMNGLPVAAHLGKTFYSVLGDAAAKVQTFAEHVFATGEPLYGVYLTALLPARREVGHWLESYIPLRDNRGKVRRIGVIALEISPALKIEASIKRLRRDLGEADALLQNKGASDASLLLQRFVSQAYSIVDDLFWNSAATAPANPFFSAAAEPSLPPPSHTNGKHTPVLRPSLPGHASLSLSSRERQVLQLVAQGKANKEIASILTLSIRTVETYRARLMLKLGLHSIPQLVRYAIRNNLI